MRSVPAERVIIAGSRLVDTAKFVDHFEEAMWNTASIRGDIDTNCAIVGGIVALSVGREGVPDAWRQTRESLWRYSTPPG
jgi:hypothetical protein